MAAFQDIAAELSKLTNEIFSAELSHGEVDFYIYKISNFTTILILAEEISFHHISFDSSSDLSSKAAKTTS